MPRDAVQNGRDRHRHEAPGASRSRRLFAKLSALSVSLLLAVSSCNRKPTYSSSATSAPSSIPSVLTVTRQPGRLVLRITSADADAPVEISDASNPDVLIQTVKANDRERAFNDLFRAYGDVRLDLAADHRIPHLAVMTLMGELRQTGFTHLQFAMHQP